MISDTLSDAVNAIDAYLAAQEPLAPSRLLPRIREVRDQMHGLRQEIDAQPAPAEVVEPATILYTIAYDDDADRLIACAPDDELRTTIAARVNAYQGDLDDADRAPAVIEFHAGLTLTDDLPDSYTVVFSSGKRGRLLDRDGNEFDFAVRRQPAA